MTVESVELPGGLAPAVDTAPEVPRITVLQHSSDVPLGLLGPALGDAVRVVRLDLGEPVPAAGEVGSGLVVLGGHMSAYDDAVAPWLPATRALLADAVRDGVPTLGVCLGAQLLAVATGGTVAVAAPPGREAGVVSVHWRAGAASDPVLGPVVAAARDGVTRAVSMHADAVCELPPGAAWLGWSHQYPYQAFRLGSALGVQFHPEAGKSIALDWARKCPDVDAAEVDAAMNACGADLAHLVLALGRAFAAQVDAYAAR
ncbi:type 1 glutamine amidotransferase [Xylanimonas sp. McL0601]|uniref:type 1 glutamine amidotransferase n=1 Tax=Xylanimonas sp. McL0601 TaxID=3414739 RepID=UPI003CE9FF55